MTKLSEFMATEIAAEDVALMKLRQKEIQMSTIAMTREEAETKLREAHIPIEVRGTYSIIDVLVALGLLHIL